MVLRRSNFTKQRKFEITLVPHGIKMFSMLFLIIPFIAGCSSLSTGAMDSGSKPSHPTLGNNLQKDVLHKADLHKVGSLCEYSKYRGKAVIVSITPKRSPGYAAGPPYEGYEVKFRFVAEEEIKEAYGKVEGREYVLTLTNSWYPGPKFLKKYSIEVGKRFDCFLNVITKGVCTPIIFDFPAIDQNDYFEIEP